MLIPETVLKIRRNFLHGCVGEKVPKFETCARWALDPVINGGLTPMSRVITLTFHL